MKYITTAVFLIFLGTAAWLDLRHRQIPVMLFKLGAGAGALLWLADTLLLGTPALFPSRAAELGGAMAIGALLMLFSRASRGAMGMGDGLFFLVAAFYLGFYQSVALLLGGMALCFLFCLGFIVWGMVHHLRVGGQKIPFLPFLVPVSLGVIWL